MIIISSHSLDLKQVFIPKWTEPHYAVGENPEGSIIPIRLRTFTAFTTIQSITLNV